MTKERAIEKEKAIEEELENLRRKLIEAGVKVLSGNWGGKGGIARYKNQWLIVMDRHLPVSMKLRLFQTACQILMPEGLGEKGE